MKDLKNRIENTNRWIKDNPTITDPNLFEITELIIELGKEALKHNVRETSNKYPTDPTLVEIYKGMNNMLIMRKLDFMSLKNNENELLKTGDPLIVLLNEMIYKTHIGEYHYFDNVPAAQELKETLLKKIMGIGLYIKQLERENPESFYDNEAEMTEVEEMYKTYMDKFPIATSRTGDPAGVPQFGYELEPVMTEIRQKYQTKDNQFDESKINFIR